MTKDELYERLKSSIDDGTDRIRTSKKASEKPKERIRIQNDIESDICQIIKKYNGDVEDSLQIQSREIDLIAKSSGVIAKLGYENQHLLDMMQSIEEFILG